MIFFCCYKDIKMEFLMIKSNLLFYRDWSEVSSKWTHMHILSLFASDY